MKIQESGENYLEMIYVLSNEQDTYVLLILRMHCHFQNQA